VERRQAGRPTGASAGSGAVESRHRQRDAPPRRRHPHGCYGRHHNPGSAHIRQQQPASAALGPSSHP